MRRSPCLCRATTGMLLNADVFGADAIILDLEDAVAPGKDAGCWCATLRALNSRDGNHHRVNPGQRVLSDDLKAVVT